MKHCWLSAVALVGLVVAAPAQPAPDIQARATAPFVWGPGLKVLIVTGGNWHDFDQWFNKTDSATLQRASITNLHTTENAVVAAREMSNADVVVMSANNGDFESPLYGYQAAFSNFVNSGKGLVLLHASIWYNWGWHAKGWHDFNTYYVGGGAREHDGVSEFDETVVKDHPVTHGLPSSFKMTDELYHNTSEPGGSPRDVLVVASKPGGQKYDSVWVVHYGNARIVCNSLGHDGSSHNSPEYQQLLVNSVKWAGGQ